MNENIIASQDGVMNIHSSFYSAEDKLCEKCIPKFSRRRVGCYTQNISAVKMQIMLGLAEHLGRVLRM